MSAAPAGRRDLLRGQALVWAAWDARGGGPGTKVPADRRRVFVDRLRDARAALAAAADADPDGWRAAAALITVSTGAGDPRPVMERWFARAMAANPDAAGACVRKGVYLLPRWRGTRPQADGFAWQCVKSGNTAGRLPEAAVRVAAYECPMAGSEYLKEPIEVQAWYNSVPMGHAALRGAEAQLRASPGDPYLRSVYARLLAFRGRVTAHEQFAALGDGYDRAVFPDPAEYARLRQAAERGWREAGGD
ncbi:MAG: hypothetical protein U0871_09440 [Gemmataceae bacterium]